MDHQADAGEDRPLMVQLELHLDRQPITGRLRTALGADERFVGWLGFVDALKSLRRHPSFARAAHDEHPTRDAATTEEPETTKGATMTGNTQDRKPTLVLGGTGKTGRRVVERLRARGLPVRVGSRSGEPPFDWEDQATWAPALEGVASAYVSYYPDIAIPGAVEQVRSFAELALEQGARRLVLLSGRGEEEAQRAERAVQETGADVTIVRCAWFMQNFSEDFLVGPVLGGEVALPAGDEPEPFIDADDIADVAVAALTDDRHIGELYELTSPRLLTFAAAIGEIARATGREIRYVPISVEEYAAGAAEHGVPPEFVEFLTYLFSEVLGRNAYLTDGVQRALGRKPRDFSDYARDAAATGVWNPSLVRA
jgi:uncharacterized protein YbjT (DUF2867 family)